MSGDPGPLGAPGPVSSADAEMVVGIHNRRDGIDLDEACRAAVVADFVKGTIEIRTLDGHRDAISLPIEEVVKLLKKGWAL